MQHFQELPKRINKKSKICDVYVDQPTFIMKIDASKHLAVCCLLNKHTTNIHFLLLAVNMYHHFCDFFNLYTSLHVNGTTKEMFSRDINVLIWETYSYHSNFGITWSAFTKNPLWNLRTFQGKRVCFREVVFPLLPRMIFGLYYNTPVVWGCQESGLFHAFSKFILHRLKIPKRKLIVQEEKNKIKITLLSRNTQYRRILNEQALLEKLKSSPRQYLVQRVNLLILGIHLF